MIDYATAIPLSEAALKLASKSLLRKYREAQTFPKIREASSAHQGAALPETGKLGIVDAILKIGDVAIPAFQAQVGIREEMRAALVNKLRAGKFLAIGFAMPRKPTEQPINIPADLYQSDFLDWPNCVVKGAGLEFVNVRIVRAPKTPPANSTDCSPTLQAEMANPVQSEARRRPPGRPSIRWAIEEAYDALEKAGKFHAGCTQRFRIKAIQYWNEQKRSLKLGDEVIRRYIVRRNSSDQRSQKL